MGHNALGAGQLIDQGAALVDNALRSGSIFSGEGWQARCCCWLGLLRLPCRLLPGVLHL